MTAPLSDEQRLAALRLIRSDRIGPRTFRALVSQFGDAVAALQALPELARRAGRGRLKVASRADAERETDALRRLGGRFIAETEPDYPRALRAIDTAPPLIAVRGEAAVLARPAIAIVGARNASAAGGAFAARLASELGQAGYAVVSGLARGIDSKAHRAAVATGTVAVLAGGHDRVYPDENRPLLEELLAAGGAAVSEMPIGWEPRGRDFPRRNRIVSGLAYGVVVVEAARRSGSLITARFALEQGREVFAVPGFPLDPRAEGTNDLIRGGATLCGSADDVLAVVAPLLGTHSAPAPPDAFRTPERDGGGPRGLWEELDGSDDLAPETTDVVEGVGDEEVADDRSRVLRSLGVTPVSVDDLARQTGLPVRSVQLVLVELELAGRLERHGAQAVSLLPQT